MRGWAVAALIVAAVTAGAGCGGVGEEPPALPEQTGVVREFRGEYIVGDRSRPIRYWLLEEEGGGRRARVADLLGDVPDSSSRLVSGGGGLVFTVQMLFVSDEEPAGVVITGEPQPMPLSTAGTAFSLEFHRELVRIGEALEVEGSARDRCTDYAAPLVTHAVGILDSVVAREKATVSTLDGAPSAVTIRLCGPQRELSRVSAPAYRITMDETGPASLPAQEWRLTLVRRRPAGERLVADTFDLARAHPGARIDPRPGGVSPAP